MKKNIGSLDSMTRIMAVAVIALLYFGGIINGTWAIILSILAVILVITAVVQVCPLYLPFGLSTRKPPGMNKVNTRS